MKKYTTTYKTTRNKSNLTNSPASEVEWTHLDFDDFAHRIDEIARRKLPDGVMGGNVAGREAEIRQKSLLMLFEGFLTRNMAILDATDADGKVHHLRKVVAIVLRRQKARMKRKLAMSGKSAATPVRPLSI